jgi:CheY-like chemotaxis protein
MNALELAHRARVLFVRDAKTKGHRLLDEKEFDVVAASGRPIRLLEEQAFDLVVTDVSAPRTRGFKFIEHIRARGIDVPAVIVVPDERSARLPERLSKRSTFICDASSLIEIVRGIVRARAASVEVPRLLGFRNQRGEEIQLQEFSATVVKNTFGRILDVAQRQGAVAITHHDSPKAVLLAVDEYNALVRKQQPQLDQLTTEFDSMLNAMQAPGMRDRVASAFAASPAELGKAAVLTARKKLG